MKEIEFHMLVFLSQNFTNKINPLLKNILWFNKHLNYGEIENLHSLINDEYYQLFSTIDLEIP